MDRFEIFRDYFGFRQHVAIDIENRNTADRKSLAEFGHAPVFRQFEGDVRNTLGVDLQTDAGRIGAEISGIECHHDLSVPARSALQ